MSHKDISCYRYNFRIRFFIRITSVNATLRFTVP